MVCKQTTCGNLKGSILGTVPADFNYDGNLDMLTIHTENNEVYNNYVFTQIRSPSDPYPQFTPSDTGFPSYSYPFLADFYGDHTTTVMTQWNGVRYIWNTTTSEEMEFAELTNVAGCLETREVLGSNFTKPHFNSVIDMNGDCRADLVITSVSAEGKAQVEFWVTMGEARS